MKSLEQLEANLEFLILKNKDIKMLTAFDKYRNKVNELPRIAQPFKIYCQYCNQGYMSDQQHICYES